MPTTNETAALRQRVFDEFEEAGTTDENIAVAGGKQVNKSFTFTLRLSYLAGLLLYVI